MRILGLLAIIFYLNKLLVQGKKTFHKLIELVNVNFKHQQASKIVLTATRPAGLVT